MISDVIVNYFDFEVQIMVVIRWNPGSLNQVIPSINTSRVTYY